MALTLPQAEPCVLGTPVVIGDTWTWELTPPAERSIADGWVLSYAIVGRSTLTWDASWATEDDAKWTVIIPAASTTALTVGTSGISVYSVTRKWTGAGSYAGYVLSDALPSLTVYSTVSRASAIEAQIEALDTLIAARNANGFEEYAIPDQSVKLVPMSDLLKQRAVLQAKLYSVRNGGRLGVGVEYHSRAAR